MKKMLFVMALAVTLFSCTQDAELNVSDSSSLDTNVNLQTNIPNQAFDNSSDGRYAGVIVSNDSDFHGKIWINVGDSSLRQFAQLEMVNTQERVEFDLTETLGDNQYRFANDFGSFDVDFSDVDNVEVSNVLIQGNPGQVRLVKETSNGRMVVNLGTYIDDLLDGPGTGSSGTWDVMVDAATALITEVIIVTDGNAMLIDSGSFEEGETGCYGPQLPFLFDTLVADNINYEMYATGQFYQPFGASGGLIVYDFNFSKSTADANTLPYSNGLGFPAGTNGIIYTQDDGMGGTEPLPVGCYNLTDRQGVFLWQNAAGDAFVAAGTISFDTSMLVPEPPTSAFGGDSNAPQSVSAQPLN